MDIPEEVARPLLEKSWPQKFHARKSALRSHLNNGGEEPPDGIDQLFGKSLLKMKATQKRNSKTLRMLKIENNFHIPILSGGVPML